MNLPGKRYIVTVILLAFNLCLIAQQAADSIIWSSQIDQVVVTAQFAPTDTRESVNAVRILNRKIIEQRGAVNLQELLQTEPNLRITQDAILGSDISINGLKGENLKILIDGVPIVGRLNGNIDAGQIPLSSILKVEIIEGAQSLLYGSEASGGVINLITRKSQLSSVDTELNGQYENNGFRNLAVRSGYSSGKWTTQATANIQEFISKPDSTDSRDLLWNPKKQQSLSGMVRFNPSSSLDLRLTGNLLHESIENLGEKKRTVFKPYAFDDYYITDRADISFFGEKRTAAHHLFQSTIGYNTFTRIKNSFRYDFDEDRKDLLQGMQDTSSAGGLLTRFTLASDKKDKKWNYIIGAENYFESAKGTRLYDSTSTNPGKAYTNDLGVFGSLKFKMNKSLTLQSGARWTNNLRYGSAFTPSTWLLWQPELPFQVRLSWAYGFRSPSVKELFFSFVDINHFVIGRPDLKPEKSINLRGEITWKTIQLYEKEVNITTTAFYNKVNDRIILTALGPVHYEYQNVDTWQTSGVSFRINVTFNSVLRFQTDVITTGFHNPQKETGNQNFLWSTDWSNDLTLSLWNGRLNWNIWHKMTGKTPFFYNDNGSTKQGFTDLWQMLNTGFSTHLMNKKIRINTGVKNIFDIRQLQANNNNGIHIEASNQQNLHWGRNFYVGMIWQWQK